MDKPERGVCATAATRSCALKRTKEALSMRPLEERSVVVVSTLVVGSVAPSYSSSRCSSSVDGLAPT